MGSFWTSDTKTKSVKITEDVICNCDLSKCTHLRSLQNIMTKYKLNKHQLPPENIENQTSYLNDYLHLITEHTTNNEFETIYNTFDGHCDLHKCSAFTRNHRDRHKDKVNTNNGSDILDKIHCHYCHSFDIGFRLKKNEIQNIENDAKNDNDEYFVDHTLIKIQKILLNKHNFSKVVRARGPKYSTLQPDDSKNMDYDFGCYFDYNGEAADDGRFYSKPIEVNKKYNDIKREMTSNTISQISLDTFNREYAKAQTHFVSNYCKRVTNKHNKILALYHLLSIMFYCNFDELSYAFSKTYRKSPNESNAQVAIRHSNFYWLGKYLKESVNWFGTKIRDGNVGSFYHGINKELLFPHLVTNLPENRIYCPLSTSSAYEVAINFANHNKGMIIEFIKTEYCNKIYFECKWLSDYSNEMECLFLQTNTDLTIGNIIRVSNGVEYKLIFQALNQLSRFEGGTKENELNLLTKTLLEHQLFIRQFSSLDSYAQKMLDTYCNNRITTAMYAENMFVWYLNDLCHEQFRWIQIQSFTALYPNVEEIKVIFHDNEFMNSEYLNFVLKDSLNYFSTATDEQLQCIYLSITEHNVERLSALKAACDRYQNSNGSSLINVKSERSEQLAITVGTVDKRQHHLVRHFIRHSIDLKTVARAFSDQ
eukprot:208931_1